VVEASIVRQVRRRGANEPRNGHAGDKTGERSSIWLDDFAWHALDGMVEAKASTIPVMHSLFLQPRRFEEKPRATLGLVDPILN
jgi:hypothetical protein